MVDGFSRPTTYQTVAEAKQEENKWLQTLMTALLKQ